MIDFIKLKSQISAFKAFGIIEKVPKAMKNASPLVKLNKNLKFFKPRYGLFKITIFVIFEKITILHFCMQRLNYVWQNIEQCTAPNFLDQLIGLKKDTKELEILHLVQELKLKNPVRFFMHQSLPPIFKLDFKFPASLLLLQQLRQVQKSQRLSHVHGCQPAVAQVRTAKIRIRDGRPARRTGKISHKRPADPPCQQPFVLTARLVQSLTVRSAENDSPKFSIRVSTKRAGILKSKLEIGGITYFSI